LLINQKVNHVYSECSLCTLLDIPEIFFSGTLFDVHSSAHISILQHRLAKALGQRFNHSFYSADIDKKIGLCREALGFLKEYLNHISLVPIKALLDSALYVHFSLSGQQDDLQEGHELLSSVVNSFPMEPQYLTDFGELLVRRYYVSESIDYLEKSVALLHRVYDIRVGHFAQG
jgi:hypothetical protein